MSVWRSVVKDNDNLFKTKRVVVLQPSEHSLEISLEHSACGCPGSEDSKPSPAGQDRHYHVHRPFKMERFWIHGVSLSGTTSSSSWFYSWGSTRRYWSSESSGLSISPAWRSRAFSAAASFSNQHVWLALRPYLKEYPRFCLRMESASLFSICSPKLWRRCLIKSWEVNGNSCSSHNFLKAPQSSSNERSDRSSIGSIFHLRSENSVDFLMAYKDWGLRRYRRLSCLMLAPCFVKRSLT